MIYDIHDRKKGIITMIMCKDIKSSLDKCLCYIIIPKTMLSQAMAQKYQGSVKKKKKESYSFTSAIINAHNLS